MSDNFETVMSCCVRVSACAKYGATCIYPGFLVSPVSDDAFVSKLHVGQHQTQGYIST
jgi:hypothetical protein